MQDENQQRIQDAYKQGIDLANNLLRQSSFLHASTSFSDRTDPPPNIHPNILYGYAGGLSLAQNLSKKFASLDTSNPLPSSETGSTSEIKKEPNLENSGLLINFDNLKKAINQEIMNMLPPEHIVDEELLEISVEEQAEKYSYSREQMQEIGQNLIESDLQFSMYILLRNNKEQKLQTFHPSKSHTYFNANNPEDIQEDALQLQQTAMLALTTNPMTTALLGLAWLAYQDYRKSMRDYRGNTSVGDNVLEIARINAATDATRENIRSLAESKVREHIKSNKL